jgi:hypothetical protein
MIQTEQISDVRDSETVNSVLRQHAVTVADWSYREFAGALHLWADRFSAEFKLDVPTPAIQIDRIHATALGTYRPSRNGFGLKHEITINTRFLALDFAEQLLTLFHELLHEWQEIHGTPGKHNHHNREFRQKALSYGLHVDERGVTRIQAGHFTNVLNAHAVPVAPLLAVKSIQMHKRTGDSKLRKWSCGCTNVRCAVDLQASCSRCGNYFQRAAAGW